MLDIRRIRKNPEEVVKALEKRHGDFPIKKVLKLDEKRRSIISHVKELKLRKNKRNKMLEIRSIRKNPEEFVKVFKKRHRDYQIKKVLNLDEKRRSIISQVEEMKSKQNTVSKQIPAFKKEGKDTTGI